MRGDYAAITAWFDVAVVLGQCGQPAALCFYVARDPSCAPSYVATSRALTLGFGALVLASGVLLSPLLAHGDPDLEVGYAIAMPAALAVFAGTGYLSALQARNLRWWNQARMSQPLLSVLAIAALRQARLLTLESALAVLAVSLAGQLAYSYRCCRLTGLAPGRGTVRLARPLAGYGLAQLTALAPVTLNAQLGQLVLSQTVPAADLGRYAVAVSLTLLPMPLVSAIGNVAFPRLAASGVVTSATRRRSLLYVLTSAAIAAGLLVPLGAVAPWLVPLVFGASYRAAVPLLWMLIPGGVCAACGQVVGDLLRGGGHVLSVARAQGPSAIVLIGVIVTLLPVVGVLGAAIASTAAYGTALALMLGSLRRLMAVPAR